MFPLGYNFGYFYLSEFSIIGLILFLFCAQLYFVACICLIFFHQVFFRVYKIFVLLESFFAQIPVHSDCMLFEGLPCKYVCVSQDLVGCSFPSKAHQDLHYIFLSFFLLCSYPSSYLVCEVLSFIHFFKFSFVRFLPLYLLGFLVVFILPQCVLPFLRASHMISHIRSTLHVFP